MTAADTVVDLQVKVKRCPECGTGFGVEAAFCPFDGIALKVGTWNKARDPLTDTVIDKRYEVVEPLGEGGMGTVYKVRHMTLDRMFAMKVLRRDLAAESGLGARFLQEARATAAIRHPSVVAINDFGELDDGAPYYVMELLLGETLATRMRARGVLPPAEAAGIARKLADALSAAHEANVVHRDLKPENVFLVGKAAGKAVSDELRIVDFGAAKIVGGSKLTRPGVVFGTPYYMSPEQASGQPVDARADVYSLGVLLYEMVTGSVPFEADTYMGVLTKHMFAEPTKPSEKLPSGVQLGELEAVVMRALQKEPAERYQSMIELAAALDRAIAGRASSAPRAESRSGRPVPMSAMSTADKIQRSVSRHVDDEARRRRRTIAIAVVSAAATLAMCAFAVALVDDANKSKQSAAALEAPRAAPPSAPPVTAATTTASAPSAPPDPTSESSPSASASASASAFPSASASTSPSPSAPTSASPLAVSTRPVTTPAPPTPPRPRPTTTAGLDPFASPRPAPTPARTASTPRSSDELPDPWQKR